MYSTVYTKHWASNLAWWKRFIINVTTYHGTPKIGTSNFIQIGVFDKNLWTMKTDEYVLCAKCIWKGCLGAFSKNPQKFCKKCLPTCFETVFDYSVLVNRFSSNTMFCQSLIKSVNSIGYPKLTNKNYLMVNFFLDAMHIRNDRCWCFNKFWSSNWIISRNVNHFFFWNGPACRRWSRRVCISCETQSHKRNDDRPITVSKH